MRSTTGWAFLAGLLVVGYVLFGRSFAYLGIPGAHVFVGEICIAAVVLFRPRIILDGWIGKLPPNGRFAAAAWSYSVFLWFGVIEVLRGIYIGFEPIRALENIVFHLYPLYLFVGMFAATAHNDFIEKTILWIGWGNCIYGLAYIVVLNRLSVFIPGTSVSLFSGPGGGSLVLIGLLCYEARLGRVCIPLLANAFLILAMQVRAEWVAVVLGLFTWSVLTRHMRRLALAIACFGLLFAAGYIFNFSIPSAAGRGGNISVQDIAGRAVASVDAEKAREFTRSADQYAGTVAWRKAWWIAIWDSVHGDETTALIGHGYGYPLGDLVPYLRDVEIRTPHNVFFYALGYGGWIGVCLFFTFQACLGYALWRTYAVTGQPFGISLWVMTLSSSLFGNIFETPFGAIPFYLLAGAALAPFVKGPVSAYEYSRGPQLVSAAWR